MTAPLSPRYSHVTAPFLPGYSHVTAPISPLVTVIMMYIQIYAMGVEVHYQQFLRSCFYVYSIVCAICDFLQF